MCGCCVNNRQQLLLYYVQSSITHNKLTPKYVLLRFCKRVQTIHTYVVSRPGYTSLFLPPSLSLSLFLSRSLSLSLSLSLIYSVRIWRCSYSQYTNISTVIQTLGRMLLSRVNWADYSLRWERDVTTRYICIYNMYTHNILLLYTQPANSSMAGNSLERSSKWPLFVNRGWCYLLEPNSPAYTELWPEMMPADYFKYSLESANRPPLWAAS